MDNDYFSHIGERLIGRTPLGLPRSKRDGHTYIIGKTGVGKSALLFNLLVQDIEAGEGVCLLDPHGDLAESLLDYIPSHRLRDTICFDAGDFAHPIGFNLLHSIDPEYHHLVASSVVGAFKSIWRDSWGPRLEYILTAGISALLECEGVSLLGLQRMLVDETYRRWVVKQVKNPSVRRFWEVEFEGYGDKFKTEALAPIQNKIGQLLFARPMRNILGQVKQKTDFRQMIDEKKIFIANLAKGQLGEEWSNLLGSLLITSYKYAALSRVDQPKEERSAKACHMFVDEFSSFTTDAFSSMMSELRKFGLWLVLAHQFTEQVKDKSVMQSILGNVGTTIAFTVDSTDAKVLHHQFATEYPASTFVDLPNFQIAMKTRDPLGQSTVLGKTRPPSGVFYGRGEGIKNWSRRNYATPRNLVEDKIQRWMGG